MPPVALDPLDLAALVASRVCHDVISPVGAIVNGLEVLEMETDEAGKRSALDLIEASAKQASARLQFCRLAFGAAGSAGAAIDLGDAEAVARGMYADGKVSLTWNAPRALLPKNRVKLLLNLLVIAAAAIPRGGVVAVDVAGGDEATALTLQATGPSARIPPGVEALVAGEPANGAVDAHGLQPYYAGLVAREAGMGVTFSLDGDAMTIRAGMNGSA